MQPLSRPQRPIIKSFTPPYPGHTIRADRFRLPAETRCRTVFFLSECALSRFVVVKALVNLMPKTIVAAVCSSWIHRYGRFGTFISDQGPGMIGQVWGTFADCWGVQLLSTAKEASHGNGLAGKHIDLVKCGVMKARELFVSETDIQIVDNVVLAKNMSPCISSGLAPMVSFLGRNDILSPLESHAQEPEGMESECNDGVVAVQNHLFR